jgi:hypothetical protein
MLRRRTRIAAPIVCKHSSGKFPATATASDAAISCLISISPPTSPIADAFAASKTPSGIDQVCFEGASQMSRQAAGLNRPR